VSGVYNGCINGLFLSNQILNGLNHHGLSRHKNNDLDNHNYDMQYLFARHLQDEQAANSNCFCPFTAVVNVIPPSAEEVQGRLNHRLEEEGVDLIVKDISTVSAIHYDAEEETMRFESEFTISFSALASVPDLEIEQLIQLVYNDLVEDYCDPLIRREVELRLTDRRRVIAPALSISGRCDLHAQGVYPTLEQEPPSRPLLREPVILSDPPIQQVAIHFEHAVSTFTLTSYVTVCCRHTTMSGKMDPTTVFDTM
jgi:hypothetical protein